jgi:malonyl CoA-acyl carrier protein transacylase
MFPPGEHGTERGRRAAALADTRVAQPALGVAGLAMADLLGRCGVRPDAVAGHSYGELVALAWAGSLPAGELVALSRARGEAILAAADPGDPGAMAAVRGGAADVRAALAERPAVVVANDNGPDQCVVSGPTAEVEAAVTALAERGLAARRLPVACAFHTPGLAPASAALAARLAEVAVAAPVCAVWSNTTAAPYDPDPAAVRALLARQVAEPVAFRAQVEAMYAAGTRVFVEAGPGRVLTQLVGRILGERPHVAVACDAAGDDGIRRFLLALAELAATGLPVDPAVLFAGRDAAVVDVSAPPPRAPYLLNGSQVLTAAGERVPGSLPAATDFPPLRLATGAPPVPVPDDPQALVAEYLRGMQQVVTAQRDVVLAALGAAPPASQSVPTSPAPREAAARPIAEPVAPPTSAAPAAPDLLATVVAIVSERTGYPAEMLDPDLDLEAELSIDSIKRIEILGELAERVGLPGMDGGEVDESVIEELALVKTLRGIVEWIDGRRAAGGVVGETTPPGQPGGNGAAAGPAEPVAADRAGGIPERYVPVLVPLLEAGSNGDGTAGLAGTAVAVVGDGDGVGARLHGLLVERGVRAVNTEAGDALPAGTATVVDLGALAPGDDVTDAVVAQFGRLRAAAEAGADRLVVVTATGGDFGLGDGPVPDAERACAGGAAAGMVRTFARERPEVRAQVVDVDSGAGPDVVAEQVLAELRTGGGPVEVGYRGDRRVTLGTAVRPLDREGGVEPGADGDGADHLGPGSVVVVTGGARGIGARVAVGLARASRCGVVLVGRTSPPADEPEWLAGADDAVAVRRAILGRGELGRPAEVEAETARVLAAREVRATLAELRRHAAFVDYRSLDVRNASAFADALADVRRERGRLDGVVHAAGVREDKLIRDKTPESFARVFDTKVGAARAAIDAVGAGGFVLLFASVSGQFGNPGQVDYAAANAVLDALARRRGPGARVVAVDWGPWAGGGMVTPELAREYERRGVGLIDPDAGVAAALAELRAGAPDAQVVVMCATPVALGVGA